MEHEPHPGRLTLFYPRSWLPNVKRTGVVLILLVAGCSGALTGGTPSPEITPAPVPAETATATQGSPVPGVTNGFLANPGKLVTAHTAALTEVGYTQVRIEHARVDDRTRWSLHTRTRVAPDGRRHTVITPKGPENPSTVLPNTTRVERYVGDSHTWIAVWRDGDVRITRYPQGFRVGRPPLYPVFGSVPLRMEKKTMTEDGVRFRLVGSGVRDEELLTAATRQENAVGPRLVATVTPSGVIQSYTFTYGLVAPPATDTQRSFTRRFRIEAVGETSVSVPKWVPGTNTST